MPEFKPLQCKKAVKWENKSHKLIEETRTYWKYKSFLQEVRKKVANLNSHVKNSMIDLPLFWVIAHEQKHVWRKRLFMFLLLFFKVLFKFPKLANNNVKITLFGLFIDNSGLFLWKNLFWLNKFLRNKENNTKM